MKKFIAIFLAAFLIIPLSLVFSTAAETNIAQGMSYTFTGKHVYSGVVSYPDDTGKDLTDGVTGSTKEDCSYLKAHWVGLNWNGENTECDSQSWTDQTTSINYITVDLTAVKSSLTKFVLYADQFADSVNKPKTVEVLVSSDGTNYSSVGTAVVAKVVDAEVAGHADYGIYTYTVTPSAAASARYVKFKITAGGAWTHVSEVQVFQDDTPSTPSTSTPTVQVPAETYSLISTDASQWLTGQYVGNVTENATVAKSGDAIVISGSQQYWPYAYYNIPAADQHKVKMSDFKLSYKFKVEDGKANFILFCEGKTVEDNNTYTKKLTHLMVPDGQPGRDQGSDDIKPGTYEGSIALSDLILEGSLTESGYITISAVKVFTVAGGKITIEKFALESIATKEVPADSSSSTPSSSSSTSSTSSTSSASSSASSSTSTSSTSSQTSSGQTKVGDNGMAVFAVLAIISLVGMSAVSLRKRRNG